MKKFKIFFLVTSFLMLSWGVFDYMSPEDASLSGSVRKWSLLPPTLAMYIIGFPSSLLYQMAFTSIDEQYLIQSRLNWDPLVFWVVFVWAPMVIFGYIQWFILFKKNEPEI